MTTPRAATLKAPYPKAVRRVLRAAAALLMTCGLLYPVTTGFAAPGSDEIFFRDPDRQTKDRIDKLIRQSTADSLNERRAIRAELEGFSYWSVDPLVSALSQLDPPVRCVSALVLDAIGDQRAIAPLREAVLRETSHPQVAAFCALALGRFRDPGAPSILRQAVGGHSGPDNLRVAAALALARIRTPDASSLLTELLTETKEREPIVSSRLLALGFFPDLALVPGTSKPSPALERGLTSERMPERHAAIIGYIVATARRRDGKDLLIHALGSEEDRVVGACLPGLATYGDSDVTEALAKTVAGRRPDAIRELACDLLAPRGDVTAKATLLKILRTQQSVRLRASAVLGLGSMDDQEAADRVVELLRDQASLVRAAAAVASTKLLAAPSREEALRRVDGRIRAGEPDQDVREVFVLARAVLSGQRRDVVWPDVSGDSIFRDTALRAEQRVLQAVNLRAEACLDLAKVQLVESQQGVDITTSDLGSGALPNGDAKGGAPFEVTDPATGQIGQPRTAAHQELRDLKVELRRRPYFTASDLPTPQSDAKSD